MTSTSPKMIIGKTDSSKYFPIKQGVACQLKWTWNTIRLYEGTSASCHRVHGLNLDVSTFENFHNDKKWVDQRKLMLEGKFPQAGCQYCENIEKNGGISDRLTHLKIPNLYPTELDDDPLAVVVTPRILEVFLDNVCNMGCIYCDESNSSQIQNENLKFGYIKVKNVTPNNQIVSKHPDFELLTEKFFTYLEKNYHQLRKLNVLGGEPFFQQSFPRLITFIENNNNPDLELTIVTNLKVSRKKLEEFVLKMKHIVSKRKIARLDITVSLDCFGDEQEYVRYGLDLIKFKENFEFLVKHRWITLNVNSTITSLTIKTMPEMIRYIKSFLTERKIFHSFGLVDGRPWLHPNIFDGKFFKNDFKNILEEMPDITEWDKNQKHYMEGIVKYISISTTDLEKLHDLTAYLDEIDRRRNLNWRQIFPWLDQHNELNKDNHVV
jgi:MoaA/NifB/PqqE/SkfB family radical SAM enzyme